jgi:hypothetical protein
MSARPAPSARTLHGPPVASRKAYLFAFLDDHSRAVMAGRWGYFEDAVRLAAALRPGLASRGVPESIYVDNGSAFTDAALKRAAARLGIKITHSAPARPQGRARSSGSCAPRGALSYPRLSREELGGRFLGLMAYPDAERRWGPEHAS